MRATILLLLATSIAAGPRPTAADAPEPDALAKAWRERAALAAKRLAGPGLDGCDRALETAFQRATEKVSGNRRSYYLEIPIGEKVMLVVYSYDLSGRLDAFGIVALPPYWFTRHVVGTKMVTVLVDGRDAGGKGCAFDLCAEDALAGAPCEGTRGR